MTRLTRTRAILGVVAAAAMTGCTFGDLLTSRDLTHSVVTNACGPADGPATAILLSDRPIAVNSPATPYVSIYIDDVVGNLSGSIPLSGPQARGSATLFAAPRTYAPATSGLIEIVKVSADSTVSGTVHLTFPDRGVDAYFLAPFRHRMMICG